MKLVQPSRAAKVPVGRMHVEDTEKPRVISGARGLSSTPEGEQRRVHIIAEEPVEVQSPFLQKGETRAAFGHHAKHGEHHLAHGPAGIHGRLQHAQARALALQLMKEVQHVAG